MVALRFALFIAHTRKNTPNKICITRRYIPIGGRNMRGYDQFRGSKSKPTNIKLLNLYKKRPNLEQCHIVGLVYV
jgi:hypothetical protein